MTSIDPKPLRNGSVFRVIAQKGTIGRSLSATELARALDHVPVGIHILSPEGKILSVNATEARKLGYRKGEMIGRSFLDFIPEDQRAEACTRFQRKLAGERVEKVAHRTYQTKKGENIFVTSEDRVIKGADGRPVLVITALTDISELHQLQQRMRELEKLDALRILSAGYSHEFNNLFAASLNAMTLAQRGIENGEREMPLQMLAIISDCCNNGVKLNHQIRAFASPAPSQLLATNYSLKQTLISAIEIFRQTLRSDHSITLAVKLNDFELIGNPDDIVRAALNLLLNARDAIQKDGKIAVQTKAVKINRGIAVIGGKVLPAGRYVKVSVTDNGSGISPEFRKKIFEPFFSTKDADKSSGMGLPMVLSALERNGGGLRLESEVGKGTTFKLYLPLPVDESGVK